MGFFDAVKQLLGGKAAPSPKLFKDLSADELARLWRAKHALPTATRLGVRDEHLDRLLPLPPVDLPSLYSPPVAGLTNEEDAEQPLEFIGEYDPRVDNDLGGLRLAPLGALLDAGEGRHILICFEGWRTCESEVSKHPTPPEGETIIGVFATSPEVDLSHYRSQGVPCHGDKNAPYEDPVTIGGVTALPHASYPHVLHIQHPSGLTYLAGSAVPLAVIEEEPDYIIGGLSIPKDTETLEAIAEDWDPQVAAMNVEQLLLLPDVKGVDGLHVGEFARSLGLSPRIQVTGQLITAQSQPVVNAAEQGDWAEVARLAERCEATAIDEAFRVLFVEGKLEDAKRLLETQGGESARNAYLQGLVAHFSGDVAAARIVYETHAQGDDAVSGAQCQLSQLLAAEGAWAQALSYAAAGSEQRIGDPIAAANHAIAALQSGDFELAQEVVQETQVTARSWLGAMLDAMLATPSQDDDHALISVAGTHLGPYASSLEALRAGRFEEAERLLRRCLELAPVHPGASAHLAMHLAAEGRHEEAMAWCESELNALPHHVLLGSIYGWLLMSASRFEEAQDIYQRILSLSDDHIDWWINLTLSQIALGASAAAERTITQLEDRVRDMDLIATLRRAARDAS